MSDVFGVTPEEGVPPDSAPTPSPEPEEKQGSSEAERRPHTSEDAGSTPAPATTPAKAEPPPEPAGPPIDSEEAAYLAGEGDEGFVLGQRKYKSLDAADHVFRRFGGRAHAAEERARKAEERTAHLETLLNTRIDPPQDAPPGAPGSTPDTAPSAPQRLTDLVKPDEMDELIAEHGPGAAYAKVAELVEQRMSQALDDRMAPLQPLVNRSQGVELATSIFDSESERKAADGSRLFPELDPDTPESDSVVAVWTEMLGDPDFAEIAFSRHGVRQAVLEHRVRSGNGQSAEPPPTPVGASRGAAIQDMARNSRGTAPSRPGPTRALPADLEEAARVAVSASQDPIFGVTRER